jgi:hypothetical protein
VRILLCVIVWGVTALGQLLPGSVSGRAVNILGEPVSGITVDGQDVASRPDGSFRVAGLPPGTHHLSVASPGYRTERLEFDLEARQDLLLPVIQVTVSNAGCPAKPHPDRRLLQRSPNRGVIVGNVLAGEEPLSADVTLQGGDERRIAVTDAKGRLETGVLHRHGP